ncbi:MAG TPA: hypothetical protein VFJ22_17130 [Dermatophilaceae bacterium]|jgi:hypothetical protein|nr:hypothetical protein [Dermatophilaceae bacterium]
MSTQTLATRKVSLPSPTVFIALVYALTVGFTELWFAGDIVFTDVDPYANDGPVESMVAIGIIGTAALVLVVALGSWLVRRPERAKAGAVVLATLSIVTMLFFWSGAPGIIGAGAAWQAGLLRGGRPQLGAARVAGIVGLFAAALNVALTVGGLLIELAQ